MKNTNAAHHQNTYWLLMMVGAVGLTLATVIGVARLAADAGRGAGEEAYARIELIWPNYNDMPQADRALIAGLAFDCRLDSSAMTAAAVVGCLESAVGKDEPHLPNGVTADAARQRLGELIEAAGARGN